MDVDKCEFRRLSKCQQVSGERMVQGRCAIHTQKNVQDFEREPTTLAHTSHKPKSTSCTAVPSTRNTLNTPSFAGLYTTRRTRTADPHAPGRHLSYHFLVAVDVEQCKRIENGRLDVQKQPMGRGSTAAIGTGLDRMPPSWTQPSIFYAPAPTTAFDFFCGSRAASVGGPSV